MVQKLRHVEGAQNHALSGLVHDPRLVVRRIAYDVCLLELREYLRVES